MNRIILNETSHHGAGAIKELSGEIKRRGLSRPIVFSDPDLIKFGVTKKVLGVLSAAKIKAVVYSDIKPNPTIENVKNGVKAYKAAKADCIVAVGGGSSMDTAKAVGIIIANPKFADVRSLDEGSFTCYNPDGSKVDMTSYKPGMWVDANGRSCTWSSGTAFWQWYIWGGKKDKDGNKIWYDGDPEGTGENQGRFMVGMHPDNVGAAKGKTITSNNRISAGGNDFDFIVTYKYL